MFYIPTSSGYPLGVNLIPASQIACHECDLLVEVPDLQMGQRAYCPRCGYLLVANRPHSETRIFAFALASLICLSLSNLFPFITLSASGLEQSVTLLDSIMILLTEDHLVLAGVVFASIVVIPAILLLGLIYVSISIHSGRSLPGARTCLRWAMVLAPWNMAEIFVIGILVSFIKVVSLADVTLGLSFWAYMLFTVGMVFVMANFDRREMWHMLNVGAALEPPAEPPHHG